MTIATNTEFLSCRLAGQKEVEISRLFDELSTTHSKMSNWSVDRIIDILDEFASNLLNRKNDIHSLYPNSGIPFIANLCKRSNLEELLDSSLGNRYCLDRFIDSNVRFDRAYRAFPCGTVVHWMAGNVPTLGFLSLLQGMLTKNANIVKLSSSSDDLLCKLLEQISCIKRDESQNGYELVQSVAVVRYDRSRRDIGEVISRGADARIIWGDDESVKMIKTLPAKLDVTDIVFPNKTSFIVIGEGVLESIDKRRLAKKIASDISIFEQKACASPHTIFIETEDESELISFAEHLEDSLLSALSAIPKMVPSQKEVSAMLNLRAQYDMFHRAWYSDGVEFTILSDDHFQLGPPVGNRTIYLRKIDKLERLVELISPKVQTIGIIATPERFEWLTELFGARGVQRFTQIGTMTNFELPWDGCFLPQHIIRWSSRFKHNNTVKRLS